MDFRHDDIECSVYCSYMEIYSDRLHDLLQPYKAKYARDPLDIFQKKAGLEIRENKDGLMCIPNLMVALVPSPRSIYQLIARGKEPIKITLQ